MHHALTVLAGAAGPNGAQPQSPLFMFVWMGLMIAIFYVLLIRPQQRREKERRKLLEAVKAGDRVVFAGGILGLVAGVKDKTFTIKISENVRIEVARHAVTQVIPKGEAPSEENAK